MGAIADGASLLPAPPPRAQSAPAQSSVTRRIGAIKAINGSTITLAPDSGPELTVTAQANARVVRIAPGEKDLKNATPITLSDLQVGDRVLVGGKLSDDSSSLAASTIVVMKATDVEAHQQQTRQDWQKRGIGGLVESVDAAGGTVTISIPSLSGKKSIAIHTSPTTLVRRYAPNSVKFEDAKPGALKDIQQGDQLRARGERSADGAQFTAEEIVTGTFPYIVGTIKSVDASAGTLNVQDILSKKTVEVKATADSQLHKIPAEMAQRFAARLRGTLPAGVPGGGSPGGSSGAGSSASGSAGQSSPSGTPASGAPAGGGMGGGRNGGPPDFQSILSRLPSSTLADLQLQKGDAVVILATQGTSSSPSTAITLLSGVEPILQAAPNAGQAMMLAPWSLGGAPSGDTGSQ
jgi:co-chaperonin GroES (HSP10)